MKKDRKEITEMLTGLWDLDGTMLCDVGREMADYESIMIDKGGIPGSGYIDFEHYGYDGGFEITIKYKRLETDVEYERRLKSESVEREKKKALKVKKDEKDRKEFERLKKKFGDKA